MKLTSQPWSRSRIRIRPRRGIASKWVAFLDDGDAASRPWTRLPIALTWRRRLRERLVTLVRVLSPAASRTPEAARVTRTHHETQFTLTRLFQRHVSFETRTMRAAALPAPGQRIPAVINPGVEPLTTGVRSAAPTQPRLERLRTPFVRPDAPAAAASSTPSISAAIPASKLSIPESIVWGPARRLTRRTMSPARVDVTAVGAAPAGAIPAARPSRLLHPIAARAFDALSPRLRLDSPAATIVRRAAAIPAQPPVSAATAAMSTVASPALVWRAPRPTAPDAPVQRIQPSASSDASRVNQHSQPSTPSSLPMPVTKTESVRAAMLPLSGPAIDRLAEDVMYRIERRIRIERERRGL